MDEERNTRVGNASRAWRPCVVPVVALVLGLSTAPLAPAQSGPGVGPNPVLRPGSGSYAGGLPTAGNDGAGRDSKSLLSLLQEEAALLENFGPDHPQVQSVRERIRLTRANLARKPVAPAETTGAEGPPPIRLTGAVGREPPHLTPALEEGTVEANAAPLPAATAPPAAVRVEPTYKNPPETRSPAVLDLVLQWIGLAVVCTVGLAGMALLAYVSYRKGGTGSPLIQVHLVNTQTGGKDAPAGPQPPAPAGPQTREPTPARAEPGAGVASPVAADEAATTETSEDTIVKQVLAMNLQLKAEMMKAAGEGGEPTPFGATGAAVPGLPVAKENPARAGLKNR
jgi:hypothetical protein